MKRYAEMTKEEKAGYWDTHCPAVKRYRDMTDGEKAFYDDACAFESAEVEAKVKAKVESDFKRQLQQTEEQVAWIEKHTPQISGGEVI